MQAFQEKGKIFPIFALCAMLSACGGGSGETGGAASDSASQKSEHLIDISNVTGFSTLPSGVVSTTAEEEKASQLTAGSGTYQSNLQNAPSILQPNTYYSAQFPITKVLPATQLISVSWSYDYPVVPRFASITTYLCHNDTNHCLNISSASQSSSGYTAVFNNDGLTANLPFYLVYSSTASPIYTVIASIGVTYNTN